ncbi:reverse transcriptase domain-containing protein, partial [Tanacetum coccineum]
KKCTKKGDFCWTTKAEEAFTQLKQHIAALPTLVAPRQGEELIIYKPATSGRMQKWSVLLGEHNISYRPRTAVKGQILADFLIEKPETDMAEYEALIAGLRIAARMGVRNLEANVYSRLVANHVLGEYVAKEDNMIQYLDKTKSLIQGFDRFTIRQVPRGDNKKADALSKIASTSFAHLSK